MNPTNLFRQLTLASALACLGPLQAEAQTVTLGIDFLQQFPNAKVDDALECNVRPQASAAGELRDALFEHPLNLARPARVRYSLDLPPVREGELLTLAFETALSDGISLQGGTDGVRFAIDIAGERVFERDCREIRWTPAALNLNRFAGKHVDLDFLTEARGNTRFDWALWGRPRLLRFFQDARSAVGTSVRFPAAHGAVAFKGPPGLEVTIRPEDKPASRGVIIATGTQTNGWATGEFHFDDAKTVELSWSGDRPPAEFWIGKFPPQLEIRQLSIGRAVIEQGEAFPLMVEVENRGLGALPENSAQIDLHVDADQLASKPLPMLRPNSTWRGHWTHARGAGPFTVVAEVTGQNLTNLHARISGEVLAKSSETQEIGNSKLKLAFYKQAQGFSFARLFARDTNRWTAVAVWRPLFQLAALEQGATAVDEIRPIAATKLDSRTIEFKQDFQAADGAHWHCAFKVQLAEEKPLGQITYRWSCDRPRQVLFLGGPNFYVGDGGAGQAKTWGLFPGLEFLYGAEPSSNVRDFAPTLADRRTPVPEKITLPLMAVTIGSQSEPPSEAQARFFAGDAAKDWEALNQHAAVVSHSDFTVAMFWDEQQRWDGARRFPAARFSSPNRDQGQENHRMELFLPSVPEFVRENSERAAKPYSLPAGKELKLEASFVVQPEAVLSALRETMSARGGLPKPTPWPRTFQEKLDVCRAGFLKTVWDDSTKKWRHCIGWAPSFSPGFAALLWRDSHLASRLEDQRQSRQRVEATAAAALKESGPGALVSQANCHIVQWEFPFLYGGLSDALNALEPHVNSLIGSQTAEGGWTYQPQNTQQAGLGQAGDSVLGTCANHAASLLRYARITGDARALAAGEKALRYMESFRVPRGGQTWECPMYEPDILAAAYAIRAYHDGYRATGNRRWLHDAVYWAESGVPFIYLWSLPDHPMMLGATIPVFGSTFYTHTWLAVPVQWCGLVYSYHVFHLLQDLGSGSLDGTGSPLPLSLQFQPAEWRRVVELITSSALHQQFADGDKIGTYPDSIARFEQRNPAFINPEDILVNVLALAGHDPDVQTARLPDQPQILFSSGAKILKMEKLGRSLRVRLGFFGGEASHSLSSGFRPHEIRAGDQIVPKLDHSPGREPGWWWDEQRGRMYVSVRHDTPELDLELKE